MVIQLSQKEPKNITQKFRFFFITYSCIITLTISYHYFNLQPLFHNTTILNIIFKISILSTSLFIFIFPYFLHSLLDIKNAATKNHIFLIMLIATVFAYLILFKTSSSLIENYVIFFKTITHLTSILYCIVISIIFLTTKYHNPKLPNFQKILAKDFLILILIFIPGFTLDILRPILNYYFNTNLPIMFFSSSFYFFGNLLLMLRMPFYFKRLPSSLDVINKVQLYCTKSTILSKREKEIIPLLMKGYKNKEIAKLLFITESTIKTHIKNIYKKTKTNSRYEFFNMILKH